MNKIGLDNASYFDTASSKLGEIRTQLDSNSDKDKMEGMKRLVAMLSKGRDVSSLFPDVVKNVVCKNLEVKKLVYIFLVHYAELEPEAALLSINSFQKALSDQNQLIRAMALRVMSSIRVLDIVQLIVLAIEKAMKDSSPYVRKTACHAIPKVYRLDPEKKDHLVGIIDTLLSDNSTIVLGSAVAAFAEVCPERLELLHAHYRKLCRLLVDVDEWGQIFIITTLTRYARTQFRAPDDPNEKKSTSFYGEEEEEEEERPAARQQEADFQMDLDHRLLLKSTQPLLQSRNSAVVMAVASLYYYIAPQAEAQAVGRSLVRLLHTSREGQYVVLHAIAAMSAQRPAMFEPQLSEFFVASSDASFSKALKLEILTNIATEANISRILREFKDYVKADDKAFVTATIQAIGRAAASIPEVTESCMHGLMQLISNPAEPVVAESVVVIKKLLQMGIRADADAHAADPDADPAAAATLSRQHYRVVRHLAKLLDTITVPMARASITWIIGEYCDKIAMLAPDVLRKLAKTFATEDDIVKLQVLNLAAKVVLHELNLDRTARILQYILHLAKFDQNYDIRDRARMMRILLVNKDGIPSLSPHAGTLFLNQKPTPASATAAEERQRFTLGSLSQLVSHAAFGYMPLPDFPESPPDPSVRVPKEERWDTPTGPAPPGGRRGPQKPNTSWWEEGNGVSDFYGEGEGQGDGEGDYEDAEYEQYEDADDANGNGGQGEDFYEGEAAGEGEGEGEYYDNEYYEEGEEYYDEGDEYYEYDEGEQAPPAPAPKKATPAPSKPPTPAAAPKPAAAAKSAAKTSAKSAAAAGKAAAKDTTLDDLFSLSGPSGGATGLEGLSLTPTSGGGGGGGASSSFNNSNTSTYRAPASGMMPLLSFTPQRKTLLKAVLGNGLEVEYSFARRSSIYGEAFSTIQLYFRNTTQDKTFTDIKLGKTNCAPGMEIVAFGQIARLEPGATTDQLLSVKFTTVSQPAKFDISTDKGDFSVSLLPQVGELLIPTPISSADFTDALKKLGGMNETSEAISVSAVNNIPQSVAEAANLASVSNSPLDGLFRFTARTMQGDNLVLVTVEVNPESGIGKCSVNCENGIFASVLLKRLTETLIKDH